jgi:hypothetical protein
MSVPSLQASRPTTLDVTEVLGFIDPAYPNAPANGIDLVDTARVLCNSPIGGQGLIQQLQQEGPVHAIMPDQDDNVIDVVLQNETKSVRAPSHQVLQRFSLRKPHQVWSREPFGKELRVRAFNLLVRLELPCPIVEVVKAV